MKRHENAFLQRLRSLDIPLLLFPALLAVYGIFMIHSASLSTGSSRYTVIQIVSASAGFILMIVIGLFDYDRVLRRFAIPFYIIAVLALLATLVIGRGQGNKSWIELPLGIYLQTSEIVKIVFIMTFGYHLGKVKEEINRPKNILFLCLHAGVIIGLVLLQGDLGSALVFVAIFYTMCFVAGVSLWYFLASFAVIGAAAPIIFFKFLKEYQRMRILVGFAPEQDPDGYGYQVLQGKRAISYGGIWGSGYGNGAISQHPTALFAKRTDMIFSVVCEELGFIGAMLFFILIIALVVRVIIVARQARKDYSAYICMGVAAVLLFQTIENVGMCLGLLPVIGITLPFMSYGGSSVVGLFLCMGVVMSVYTHRVKYYFEREKL